MPAHRPLIVCSPPTHRLLIAHSSSAHCPLIAHSSSAHRLLIVRSLPTFTTHSSSAHHLPIARSLPLIIHSLPTRRSTVLHSLLSYSIFPPRTGTHLLLPPLQEHTSSKSEATLGGRRTVPVPLVLNLLISHCTLGCSYLNIPTELSTFEKVANKAGYCELIFSI